MPTIATFDFSNYSISNARVWRGVYDSATSVAFEIIASGSTATDMSLMSIREARLAADLATGSGIHVLLSNPNADIKTLDITGNYIVSKDPDGSFIDLDSASTGYIRSTEILGNFFGEATAGTRNMAAAIRLGTDNTLVSGNTLQSAREGSVNPASQIDYFAKATRASLNTVLVANVAMYPLTKGFLDETAFTLGEGRQVVANTGAPIASARRLLNDYSTSGTAKVTPTGLSIPVKANTSYRVTGTFAWTSAIQANGAGFAFNTPASPAYFAQTCQTNPATGTTPVFAYTRAPNDPVALTSVDVMSATMLTVCTALFKTGASGSGNVAARMTAANANTVTLLGGSLLQLDEVP